MRILPAERGRLARAWEVDNDTLAGNLSHLLLAERGNCEGVALNSLPINDRGCRVLPITHQVPVPGQDEAIIPVAANLFRVSPVQAASRGRKPKTIIDEDFHLSPITDPTTDVANAALKGTISRDFEIANGISLQVRVQGRVVVLVLRASRHTSYNRGASPPPTHSPEIRRLS